MEKLIELLNEREKELSPIIQVEWTELSVGMNRWYLISKECGFIKWLTESRKINRKKVNFQNIIYDYDEDLSDEEKLLMLLVIQDKPINFLISILK